MPPIRLVRAHRRHYVGAYSDNEPPPGADPGVTQRDQVIPLEIPYQDLLRLPFKDHGRSPAEGFDCWGLVKYVLERMGHPGVPDFVYDTALDASNVGALIARERAVRAARTTADEIGALVVIRNHPKIVNHVGIIVQPQRFLHVLRSDGVVVDHARRPPWAKRIQGFYRLKKLTPHSHVEPNMEPGRHSGPVAGGEKRHTEDHP